MSIMHGPIVCSSVFVSVCTFSVWPKTTLLPVWPRDAKRWAPAASAKDSVRKTALGEQVASNSTLQGKAVGPVENQTE